VAATRPPGPPVCRQEALGGTSAPRPRAHTNHAKTISLGVCSGAQKGRDEAGRAGAHRSAKAAWHALGAAANVGRPAGINPVCRQTDAGCVLGVGDAAACFPLAVHAGGAVFAPTLLHERWGRADQVESPFAACSRSSTVSALTIVPPPDLTSLTDRDACHGRSFVIHYTPLGVLELDGSDPSPT